MSPLLLIVIAFILGVISYFLFFQKASKNNTIKKWRLVFYKITTVYLLFKIGFVGGTQLTEQSLSETIFPVGVALFLAFFWTFFVLFILKRWSSFDKETQASVAAHFGSVSVGTFIAALAFLEAAGIPFDESAALWLAVMELPAILVAAWKLPIPAKKMLRFLLKDWSLNILIIAIFLGGIFGNTIPFAIKDFLFGTLFLPLLLYFIFEIGEKAGESFQSARKHIASFLTIGIAIPIAGGIFGSSLGFYLGYSLGNSFILAILVASASYVLAPLCMQEILKLTPNVSAKKVREIIAISMSLSVGITLPFNIIIGLEFYRLFSEALYNMPTLAIIGVSIPFFVLILGLFKQHFLSFWNNL